MTYINPSYPSNSDNRRKPEKHVEQIVSEGGARVRKTSTLKRLGQAFIAEDLNDVKEHVVWDVAVPSVKGLIVDSFISGVEHLFGETRRRYSRGTSSQAYRVSGGGYSSYSKAYKRDDFAPSEVRDISRQARATHDFGEIVIDSREEAYDVLDKLKDLIEMYEVASVGDLYSLLGITANHVDENWGWHDLSASAIVRSRDGFFLDLPKPENIRNDKL